VRTPQTRPLAIRDDARRFWTRIGVFVAVTALAVYAGWFAPWSRPRVPPVVSVDNGASRIP
jgi:hypothetical protein